MKWFYAIFTLLFVAFAGFLIWNTLPQPVKDCIVTINVVEAKDANIERVVEISERTLKDTLQQAAYAARQEAQAEYDKNFSTLLTILTIFGIAWPLMVAFVQYKLNEKELNKIQSAKKKAEKALKEIEQTDVLAKRLFDLFQYSSKKHWETMYMAYVQTIIHMQKTGEDKQLPTTLNFNKLMAICCMCSGFEFGLQNKLKMEDVDRLTEGISNFHIEKNVDDVSAINEGLAEHIVLYINNFVEEAKDASIKSSLEDILKKTNDVVAEYRRLVPEETAD